MKRDDCPGNEAELSALLDGELAAPEAAAVEAHVRACPACAALLRDLSSVGRALRSWEPEAAEASVSPGFRARLLSRVAEERRDADRASPRPAVRAARVLPWLLPAAAASLLAAAGGFLLRDLLLGEAPAPASPVAGTGAPLSARRLLDVARAAGDERIAREAVLAAYGLDPADPEVRQAVVDRFGFDPAAPAPVRSGAPTLAEANAAGPAEPGPAGADGEPAVPGLWVGTRLFEAPGAYDDFLAFRDREREMEIAAAAREAVLRPDANSVAVARAEPPRQGPLSRALAALDVGAPVGGDGTPTWQGVVVYPLRATAGFAAAAAADAPAGLEEALHPRARRAAVSESQGRAGGSVLVSNHDRARDLLVLAGQVLEGGRADRMAARDVLVPAGAANVPVPVYDVEAGNGSGRPWATRFQGVAGAAGPRLRALALAQAEPAEVRAFVRGRLDLLDVTSLRRSLSGAYDERGPAAPYLRAVREQVRTLLAGLRDPDVVGFAVAQGKDLLSLEVFGSHALLLREAPRVLEGCALEALTYAGGGAPPSRGDVAAMLAAAGRGATFGGGDRDSGEVGFLSPEGGLLGSGVVKGGALLHATVLRGAGSAALAGRRASGADLPGTTVPSRGSKPAGDDGKGETGGAESSGSGAPSSSGSGESKTPDSPSPDQRPR